MLAISNLRSSYSSYPDQNNQKHDTDTDFSLDFDLMDKESQLVNENENYEGKSEEDEEFSFAIKGGNSSPISADVAFQNGQIRPSYPLFNQDLLQGHEDFNMSEVRLPLQPPVKNVFIETPQSSENSNETGRIPAGPYCEWTKAPELSKKSNSTGFSKLWRFKDYMPRSNSDGRDTFVFLNNSDEKVVQRKSSGEVSSEKKTVGDGKNSVGGEKKKVKKGQKTTTLSPHEVYLRSKGQEKRRSYLPYRPELVGFFTNVNGGGLSKNVHPY